MTQHNPATKIPASQLSEMGAGICLGASIAMGAVAAGASIFGQSEFSRYMLAAMGMMLAIFVVGGVALDLGAKLVRFINARVDFNR